MKTYKIVFWISSSLIAIFQGLIPIFQFKSSEYLEDAERLGYPEYILPVIAIFRFFGAGMMLLPVRSKLLHEWAYAGFSFMFIVTAISYYMVEGLSLKCIESIIYMGILAVSYISLLNIRAERERRKKEKSPSKY